MKRLALIAAAALGACGSEGSGGPRVQLEMLPLSLDGVGDVELALRVYGPDGGAVWSEEHLFTSQYGFGGQGLSYIGTCDATVPEGQEEALNTVQLVLRSLRKTAKGAVIDAATWVNPAPDVAVGDPRALTLTFPCLENEDQRVTFDVTVARDARQGFFDIAVDFEDVFCSAKLDCQNDDGPLALLIDPDSGKRAATAVMGFACAAGDGQPVTLYLSDIRVTCTSDGTVTYSRGVDAAAETQGNQGGEPPALFEVGNYWGAEQLGLPKCYWNHALGLDLEALAGLGTCTLEAWGTASHETWGDLATPEGKVYPVIHWNAVLTEGGQIACTQHPVGSDEVAVEYPADPQPFAASYECGDRPFGSEQEKTCLGDDAVASIDGNGALTIAVDFGGQTLAAVIDVPAGTRLGGECCTDYCCQ